jgi:GH15 family glucan-1,4-alpha-glucosidase
MMANRDAPIEDYGIIGDLHTVALVGKNASIDFLCLPSFDSPSVFAALLDADGGGRFQIAPLLDDAVHKQLYLPDTNVLLPRFLSDSGVAEVSDFMPVEDAGVAHNLVRRAKTVRGEIRFRMRCEPRFDYARATHTVERRSDKEILFVGRSGARELVLRLRSSVPMQIVVRFVSPTDPRWIDTLRGIEQELVSDSLVYRYRLGGAFLRRPHRPGGHLLDVLLLVRRVPVPHG